MGAVAEKITSHRQTDFVEELRKIRNDPWYFLSTCVYTLDQTDKKNPVKKFPSEGDKAEYLKLYVRCWQNYPFIAVPKSRRMFMSWVNLSLYLWDSMWHIGRANAFVSKKEEDSDELINKCKFILDNIPEDRIPRQFIPKYEKTYCKLKFPEINSYIQGFPQGQDQLRQFTLSGIFADEMAFWEKAQETYAASIPTLEGGGRMTCVSSPGPGFFKRLVFDQLEQDTGE